jgi:hypothetical protein
VYLTGVHLMGVYLMGVYLMGVQLIGVYLMGVDLIDVYFMDMYMFPNPKRLWVRESNSEVADLSTQSAASLKEECISI